MPNGELDWRKPNWGQITQWLFMIAAVLAIVYGLALGAAEENVIDTVNADWTNVFTGLLAGIGFVVGILTWLGYGTIKTEELNTLFLAALIILVIGGSALFTEMVGVGSYVAGIMSAFAIYLAPFVGLVALKLAWKAGLST